VKIWKLDPSNKQKRSLTSSSRVTLLTNMPVPDNAKDAGERLRKHARLWIFLLFNLPMHKQTFSYFLKYNEERLFVDFKRTSLVLENVNHCNNLLFWIEGQFLVIMNGSKYAGKNHHYKAGTTNKNHHYITFKRVIIKVHKFMIYLTFCNSIIMQKKSLIVWYVHYLFFFLMYSF